MRGATFYIPVIIIAGIFAACKKPYNPTVTATNANILVVEGFINAGTDSTIIKLSRTVLVNNTTTANPETKAVITVENAQGALYALTETIKGTYAARGLKLDSTRQYHIRVKTSNGKTYLSDLVDVKTTPAIDSVGYKYIGNGLQIYANTHSPTNNTRYYKYTYKETWRFHARYASSFITNGTAIVGRNPSQLIYYCFTSDSSTNILINSTAALSQDVAYQFPITTINSNSEKIELRYSILLTQFALTKDAYVFWQNLKKNTEQLGSIFDAQPSQLTGNIHNIADASEPVIGYISVGNIQQKRIFIDNSVLPRDWRPLYPYDCGSVPDTALYCRPAGNTCGNEVLQILIPKGSSAIPLDAYYILPAPTPAGYTYADAECADCTIRGRTQQPAFWK